MKKLKILISNDDGIQAAGLARLAAAAVQFGEIWVAAPQSQCSGMSQKLTISGEIAVARAAFPVPVQAAWAIGGTPADCVQTAIYALMPERPDIVFSGVNFGYNAGFDIAYSGTMGAALEAVMNGVPAIAFSKFDSDNWQTAEQYLPRIIQTLLQKPLGPGAIWNVNFPDCGTGDCRGIRFDRTVAHCRFYQNVYTPTADGTSLRLGKSCPSPEQCAPDSDIRALLDGYISIGTVKSPLFE